MTRGTMTLERQLLALFRLAFRQGRSDVAEHLLRALEVLDQNSAVSESSVDQHTVAEAYYELIRSSAR